MIKNVMSKNFVFFSATDPLEKLMEVISAGHLYDYVVVAFPENRFSVIRSIAAKEALQKIGEKLGKAIAQLPFASVGAFCQSCDCVDINESELVAHSRAQKSPAKQIVVLQRGSPVGVLQETVRSALFGGLPGRLFGERFDIFEKGAVQPRCRLRCPKCFTEFDFYEPRIESNKILYCCPHCQIIIDEDD
jgi:hypothetical protein